jgi:hypothetical protein
MTWTFEVAGITGKRPDHASARLAAADVLRRLYLAARRDGEKWLGYRATIREVNGNGVEQATIAGQCGKRQPSVRWR